MVFTRRRLYLRGYKWTPFVRVVFRYFEPQGIGDWLRIPLGLVGYVFAWAWTESWRLWLKWKHRWLRKVDPMGYHWRVSCPGGGRHTQPDPVLCHRCFWGGPVRWLVHTYTACGEDDVEPVDECPHCGMEL
jgi:hypothetical protein